MSQFAAGTFIIKTFVLPYDPTTFPRMRLSGVCEQKISSVTTERGEETWQGYYSEGYSQNTSLMLEYIKILLPAEE